VCWIIQLGGEIVAGRCDATSEYVFGIVACDLAARFDLAKLRPIVTAACALAEGAPGAEAATCRRIRGRWKVAAQNDSLGTVGRDRIRDGDSGEQ
jgi:hypothetical protein